MSKSIYEEALLKLREIAEKLTRKQWIELTNNIELIRSNLQQGQKQEKLLELYRKHYKLVPFMPGLGDNAKTVIDNSRKIEQIEKELEK